MKRVSRGLKLVLALALAMLALRLAAAEKDGDEARFPRPADRKVDFVKDIQPILSDRKSVV